MEYVNQRGSFDDVLRERIAADFAALYPAWKASVLDTADFTADVEAENR